ncbi:MAG: glycosyltransferase [Hyphomicrobiales bacterium]|nr:glycosyltransferase [Hyphomicrobiales bacterium]
MQIPRMLHMIWIGDDNPRPDACLKSWRDKHPEWEVKVWNDRDLYGRTWRNQKHIDTFLRLRKWPGVADLMRYEILYENGGVYVDADSVCLRPLDDWLLESEMFACWTNEFQSTPLIANGFLGTVRRNPFLARVIERAAAKSEILRRWSWSKMSVIPMGVWRSVGPYHLTECVRREQYDRITILPSHMFLPRHYNGRVYAGGGLVYADHFWGTTTKSYGAQQAAAQVKRPAAVALAG